MFVVCSLLSLRVFLRLLSGSLTNQTSQKAMPWGLWGLTWLAFKRACSLLFFTAFINITGEYSCVTNFSCWKHRPKDGLEALSRMSSVYKGQRGPS